jgi:hypothetical protein
MDDDHEMGQEKGPLSPSPARGLSGSWCRVVAGVVRRLRYHV